MRGLPQRIAESWERIFESADAKWARKRRMLGYDDVQTNSSSAPRTTTVPAGHRRGADFGATLGTIYIGGMWISGVIIFVGCWIYCIATYGFLFGVGLGWLPSIIVAFLTAWLWPLAVAGVVAVLVVVLK